MNGLCNIIDNREQPHRWKTINAVIEATWHDNSVKGADIIDEVVDDANDVSYEQRENISVQDAISWANAQLCPVTLYLYDQGEGF